MSTKNTKKTAPKGKNAPKAAAVAPKKDNGAPKTAQAPVAQAPVTAQVVTEQKAVTEAPASATAAVPAARPTDALSKKDAGTVAKKDAGTVAVKSSSTVAVVGEKAVAKTSAPAQPREIVAGGNPYLPDVATVVEVITETPLIKTLRVVLDDPKRMAAFSYQPGQVAQLSLFGIGEATFVINSPPSQKDYLQFSIMRAGEVTAALHTLAPGDKVGVRAPLGNSFPHQDWKGKNIVFVGGGIGMAPIRTIMLHVLENKKDYGKISLLYGARTPRDMSYSYETEDWLRRPDLDCTLAIDAPFEGWEHKVGLIPHVLLEMGVTAENTIAVLCGPPVMIKFTVEALKKLNFPDTSIVTTLERRMKCGVGLCGRCNLGGKYVCVDGPVFTWAEIKQLPAEL